MIDRTAGMDFYAPGFHAGLDETYIAASSPERSGELVNDLKVFHAVTPATRSSCNYFFAFGGTSAEGLAMFCSPSAPMAQISG